MVYHVGLAYGVGLATSGWAIWMVERIREGLGKCLAREGRVAAGFRQFMARFENMHVSFQ
jgi:hypothetical protein